MQYFYCCLMNEEYKWHFDRTFNVFIQQLSIVQASSLIEYFIIIIDVYNDIRCSVGCIKLHKSGVLICLAA